MICCSGCGVFSRWVTLIDCEIWSGNGIDCRSGYVSRETWTHAAYEEEEGCVGGTVAGSVEVVNAEVVNGNVFVSEEAYVLGDEEQEA